MNDQRDELTSYRRPRARISLLGGFRAEIAERHLVLPLSAQRVLALLACRPGHQERSVIGKLLYADHRTSAQSSSLRSALWRIGREAGEPVVTAAGHGLSLADNVETDLQKWTRHSRQLSKPADEQTSLPFAEALGALAADLLPAWADEWLSFERQRWDQLRLHALERLAEQLARQGRYMESVEAALTAIAVAPQRGSAHRVLIGVYLAEGNRASAVEHYRRYQRVLSPDLGGRPILESLGPRTAGPTSSD